MITTDNSFSSLLFANREAAEAAALALREAGFSQIVISEGAPAGTAPPTFGDFYRECVARLRRFARLGARGVVAAETLRAGSFTRTLSDLGVSPQEAAEISRRICAGAALVSVRSADAADRALAVMRAFAQTPGVPRKVVITEIRRFEVPVSREELVIERRSGSEGDGFQEVRIPLTREEVHIDKRTVISDSLGEARSSDERASAVFAREN